MMASVSTLGRSSGTTRPYKCANFSIVNASVICCCPTDSRGCSRLLKSALEVADVHEAAGDRRGRGHGWTYQMRSAPSALPALEVAIGSGRAALARLEPV